jgi:shikimate kinase
MGAGKSSVGRCLQQRTGLAHVDTDELVSATFGHSITEIFSRHDETRFRDAETEALRELELDRQSIIVTGGGIVLREENADRLKRLGTVIWLDADEATLFGRATRKDDRPLLQTENPHTRFSELLHARRPLYAKIAEIRIDTSKLTCDEVADVILKKIDRLVLPK